MDSGSSDADKQAKQNHEKSGECWSTSSELRWLVEYNPLEILDRSFLPFGLSADDSASSGAWPVGEGRKAPLVASDSSSSGGSDSEEDDKNAGAPPAAAVAPPTAAVASETPGAPGNKTADLKRFASF